MTGTVPDSLPRLGPCNSPPFRQVPGDSTAGGLHAVTSRCGLEIVPPRGLVPESSLQPAPAAGPTPAAGCSRRPESAARSSRRPRGCLHAHGSPAAMRSRSPPASIAGCTPAAGACGQVLLDESPATATTPQPAAHRSVTAPPPMAGQPKPAAAAPLRPRAHSLCAAPRCSCRSDWLGAAAPCAAPRCAPAAVGWCPVVACGQRLQRQWPHSRFQEPTAAVGGRLTTAHSRPKGRVTFQPVRTIREWIDNVVLCTNALIFCELHNSLN